MTEQKRSRAAVHNKRRAEKNPNKKNKKPLTFGKIVKRIFLTFFVLGVLGLLAGGGVFAYYASTAPELDEELLKDPLSSVFYDRNGEVFATLGAENREYVKYEDIPPEMVEAILATEDVRFFEHGGMDFYRLGGAILANITQGFGAQGASTITQQVVKNSFLHNEKKLKRKAQEAWLSFKLERKYSKEEIFEMYFNKVLMSGRIYGFGTAAKYFYNKELDDLTLAERALLAGMPQMPNGYNPLKYPEEAKKRRNIVLSLMAQHNKISQSQMKEAQQADVTADLTTEDQRQKFAGSKYDAFLDVVINELENNDDGKSLSDGIKVYTTLNPEAQEIVENIMNNPENFPTENIQSGVAVINTKNGEIQAVGGGREYGAERGFNYAEDLKLSQPGSTMKPLFDYGPAIEYLNWSTGQTIVDGPVNYSGSSINVNNIDHNYLGSLTMRQALFMSRNTAAVKTVQEVGIDKSVEFAKGLGIDASKAVESDALGGGNITMSPIKMAAAYAAFGNEGVYNTPHAVDKIIYRDGVSSKNYQTKSNVAMSDSTAYMITDMLRDVVSDKNGASGTAAGIAGLDVAGKTGTTSYDDNELQRYNLSNDSVPETWFAGYTTQYSIAVWSGYAKRSDAMTTMDERRLPQQLFKKVMSNISSGSDTLDFQQPSSVVEADIEVGSQPLRLASASTPKEKRRSELFVRGHLPAVTEIKEEPKKEATLAAPSGVSAAIDGSGQAVTISWSHEPPTVEKGEATPAITFEVSVTSSAGETTSLGTTSDKTMSVAAPAKGNNYTYSVVAVMNGMRSAPGTAVLQLKTEDEDKEDDKDKEPTNPEQPEKPDDKDKDPKDPNKPGNNTGGNGNNSGGTNNGGNEGGNTTPPDNPSTGSNGNNSGGNDGGGNTAPPEEPANPNPPPATKEE